MGRRRAPAAARAAAVLLCVVLVVGAAWWWVSRDADGAMTASSQGSAHPASLAAAGRSGEWRSDGETVGAWLQRSWESPIEVSRVSIRVPDDDSAPTAGYLRFSDGSQVAVTLAGTSTVVALVPREVTSMRFTVTAAGADASAIAVAELDADGGEGPDGPVESADDRGDAAPAAALSGATTALVDRDPQTSATVDGEVGLAWDRPRELNRVEVAGTADGAALRSATLEFSDGSTLPVGEVTTDPDRPTVVAFMPRSTTSLRLVLDADTPVQLSSLAVLDVGAAPARAAGGSTPEPVAAAADGACTEAQNAEAAPLVVLCPTSGAEVGDSVQVSVRVSTAFTDVAAAAWSADGGEEAGRDPARATVGTDGTADLELPVGDLPPGPLTIAVSATGPGSAATSTYLQVVRSGALRSDDPPAIPGRDLVYVEDFDEPLAINRTGADADYAAGKPESGGVADFGEAIFADPLEGLGNVDVADGFLRLAVSPRPADVADPQGWGREHLGGMLASARPGGSGVSAQFGYFEARMATSAAPGTWPAFWLLTTPNLVEPQPVVAEIDTVELYGHDPVSACHTSHQYPDPDEVGEALCGRRWDSPRDALQWHTYGVDVRPDRIVYYIDGEQVADAPQVAAADEPMFFMLDLALGGGWPVDLAATGGRAQTYVDWVRVHV